MKLLYKENKRMRNSKITYYDAFKTTSNGFLEYASLWIEYDTTTTAYTPCKWGQRLQPCATFEQARNEMVAFDVIRRLEQA